MNLTSSEEQQLVTLAFQSIDYGLAHGREMVIHGGQFSTALQEQRATFVTLRSSGELRGCVGAIYPQRSLAHDVVYNSYASAFRDDRFLPLGEDERENLRLSISVLGPLERISVTSRAELLSTMRPGLDGVIIRTDYTGGTFLPVMWKRLPEKEVFLDQLMVKAGLPVDFWSEEIQVDRFLVENTISSPGYEEEEPGTSL